MLYKVHVFIVWRTNREWVDTMKLIRHVGRMHVCAYVWQLKLNNNKCVQCPSNSIILCTSSMSSLYRDRIQVSVALYQTCVLSCLFIRCKSKKSSIKMYRLGQDHLEMLFGRCHALNGYNDNPTVYSVIWIGSISFRPFLNSLSLTTNGTQSNRKCVGNNCKTSVRR